HYLREEDAHAHDVLVCVQTGKVLTDSNRLKFATDQFFLKSAEQMARVFKDAPDVLSRTLAIAERCNLKLEKVGNPFPHFEVPAGYTLDSYFDHVARQGFARRMETVRELERQGRLKQSVAEYEQRLSREITIIQQMRFAGYFLIVWDFVRYAREKQIPVGPGRGSAAGSLVSYSLGITDIDPLQNGLLFERFLNPERVSLPDIDIDFCMNRRGEVIDYVTQKYGRENVAQIITFGTMAAKAAIKDVGRAMGIPYGDVDRIAKMVPPQLNITLEKALKDSPQLQATYQSDSQMRELLDTARKLEGLVRNAGVHAAGVVIAPQPLIDLVPLHKTKNEEIVTAFDMNAVEKLGLLKMDFLGLTTLTVLDDALKLIRQRAGGDGAQETAAFDLERAPLDDQQTFEGVFHKGLTSGVFQFESPGMRRMLLDLKPDRIEDLIAANALFRPGPMELIPEYTMRKHGRQPVPDVHPVVNQYTAETYGIMVYQEQVMQILHGLGDIPLRRAYT
ncbi:MAG: DNA polymerase III subunit alpha, partial [Terriglobales bacterium]